MNSFHLKISFQNFFCVRRIFLVKLGWLKLAECDLRIRRISLVKLGWSQHFFFICKIKLTCWNRLNSLAELCSITPNVISVFRTVAIFPSTHHDGIRIRVIEVHGIFARIRRLQKLFEGFTDGRLHVLLTPRRHLEYCGSEVLIGGCRRCGSVLDLIKKILTSWQRNRDFRRRKTIVKWASHWNQLFSTWGLFSLSPSSGGAS